MAELTQIPTASKYSMARSGRVYSHRGIGRSTKHRTHELTAFKHQGWMCYSIIHDDGTKRTRKIADLLELTFGED